MDDRPEPQRCKIKACPVLTRHPSQLCPEHRQDVAHGVSAPDQTREPSADERERAEAMATDDSNGVQPYANRTETQSRQESRSE